MRKLFALSFLAVLLLFLPLALSSQNAAGGSGKSPKTGPLSVDTRVDNMGYWREMARQG